MAALRGPVNRLGVKLCHVKRCWSKRKSNGTREKSVEATASPATSPYNSLDVPRAGFPTTMTFETANNGPTLSIALRNDTTSSDVFAYITGRAIDNDNALVLLQSDATTPYYPTSPPSIGTALVQNCAIALGPPGSVVTAQIPHIAGGRVWFAIDGQITFLLNPGPALVEPSVSNPSDPSIDVNWGFCEFTWNAQQLYANISYVDFVSLPISLTLTSNVGATQHVSGMSRDGLSQVAADLHSQSAKDGKPWSALVVPARSDQSKVLRVLSPNTASVGNSQLFAGYFEPYVNDVYSKFATAQIHVDTQASYGVVQGQVSHTTDSDAVLNVGGSTFAKPSTGDIFSCSTGPFATGSNAEKNAIIPRLAAGFNRSVLLSTNTIPAPAGLYYQTDVTNHYARVVHRANLDGKGHAFPYDDVQRSGDADASGKVQAGDPVLWTVAVGGGQASFVG